MARIARWMAISACLFVPLAAPGAAPFQRVAVKSSYACIEEALADLSTADEYVRNAESTLHAARAEFLNQLDIDNGQRAGGGVALADPAAWNPLRVASELDAPVDLAARIVRVYGSAQAAPREVNDAFVTMLNADERVALLRRDRDAIAAQVRRFGIGPGHVNFLVLVGPERTLGGIAERVIDACTRGLAIDLIGTDLDGVYNITRYEGYLARIIDRDELQKDRHFPKRELGRPDILKASTCPTDERKRKDLQNIVDAAIDEPRPRVDPPAQPLVARPVLAKAEGGSGQAALPAAPPPAKVPETPPGVGVISDGDDSASGTAVTSKKKPDPLEGLVSLSPSQAIFIMPLQYEAVWDTNHVYRACTRPLRFREVNTSAIDVAIYGAGRDGSVKQDLLTAEVRAEIQAKLQYQHHVVIPARKLMRYKAKGAAVEDVLMDGQEVHVAVTRTLTPLELELTGRSQQGQGEQAAVLQPTWHLPIKDAPKFSLRIPVLFGLALDRHERVDAAGVPAGKSLIWTAGPALAFSRGPYTWGGGYYLKFDLLAPHIALRTSEAPEFPGQLWGVGAQVDISGYLGVGFTWMKEIPWDGKPRGMFTISPLPWVLKAVGLERTPSELGF